MDWSGGAEERKDGSRETNKTLKPKFEISNSALRIPLVGGIQEREKSQILNSKPQKNQKFMPQIGI